MKACPLCGGEPAETLSDCRDLVYGVPGSWTYRRCFHCRSLWMDPLPEPEQIASFYPEPYYTHQPAFSAGADGHPLTGLFSALKYAGLERHFGYRVPHQWWEKSRGYRWVRGVKAFAPRFPAGRMVFFLPSRPKGKLLDVGCGRGEFLARMRELGWEVEGVEPDARAAAAAARWGFPVRQGSIESVDLEPDSFDAITLGHVIEHLLDPREALGRCIGALREGGLLVTISPNPLGRNARLFGRTWRGLEPPRHLILPSPRGFRAMLEGFPVTVELLTSPLHMGTYWRRSGGRRSDWSPWLEKAYGAWLDFVAGPFLVAFHPEEGEECVCIVRKERTERSS